jgi:LPXTG-motif cell wall-anchored protein
VPVNLPGISSVDWRLIVGIVGGALLALGLILFYRRRKRLTTGT